MLLGSSMSKEKVFHDSYLDVDSREQDYWEWFEKMHNEHPTPEEVQASIDEREKMRAEVLARRERIKFWEDWVEKNCKGAPEGLAACLQRQYELMTEKYPNGVPAEVLAEQFRLHPAHIGFAKNPFEEIDMQAFRLTYKITEETKK